MVAVPAGGQLVPIRETQALLALDEARRAITAAREAHDADALREWRDRAAAVQHYARQRGDAQDVANDAGEVKLRAERALGSLDLELNPHGKNQWTSGEGEVLRVGKDTRAAWRKLGGLDDATFDTYLARAREDEQTGVSTAKLLRLVTADATPHRGGWGGALGREVTGYSQPRRRHVRQVLQQLEHSVVGSVRDETHAAEFTDGVLSARPPAPLIVALQNVLAVERAFVAGGATVGDVESAYLSVAVIAVLRAECATSSLVDEKDGQADRESLAA